MSRDWIKALDHRGWRTTTIRGDALPRAHILGPTLAGFYGLFEVDYGTPTDETLPTITPSFVGNSMLPFRCPGCKSVSQELACPETREHYRDKRIGRDNHWCPNCGQRFRINMDGVPLTSSLAAGANVGPSKVEHRGKIVWQDRTGVFGVMLGVLFPLRRFGSYEALAQITRTV